MPLGRVPKRTSGSAGMSLFACGQGSAAAGGLGVALERRRAQAPAASANRGRRSFIFVLFRESRERSALAQKSKSDQAFRAIVKPAKLWLTGISSIVLMLRCGGRVATQWIVSAMSSAVIGSMSA